MYFFYVKKNRFTQTGNLYEKSKNHLFNLNEPTMKKRCIQLCMSFLLSVGIAQAQKTAKINLTNWKLSIPEGVNKTFKAPKLLDYANDKDIQKYMFDDYEDKSLVFYAFPSLKSKRPYTKVELKEQNSFGSDIGWTFKEGAKLKIVGKMGEISKKNDKSPRVIFLQIGGRISDDQANMVGASDNNAPAILKVYWDNGFIKLRSKKLKVGMQGDDIYREESWEDDDGFAFKDRVDQNKFTFEIEISDGKMEVTLNKKESKVYSGDNYKKWNNFDNYFTVGCNLQSEEVGAFANMKFFSLDVSH